MSTTWPLDCLPLTAEALAAHADDQPALRAKARRKVVEQAVSYERGLTPAMRSTARDRLYERARRGHWTRFPASPQPWYDRIVNHLGEQRLHKNATFRLERRIQAVRDRHDRATASDPSKRLAWRRALPRPVPCAAVHDGPAAAERRRVRLHRRAGLAAKREQGGGHRRHALVPQVSPHAPPGWRH